MILNRMLPKVLCPWCVHAGGLGIWFKWVAKPIGSFALAGTQIKLSVSQEPVLKCTLCKEEISGRVDGGDAVFPDPHA